MNSITWTLWEQGQKDNQFKKAEMLVSVGELLYTFGFRSEVLISERG
jgi:hypothetical protein